MRLGPSGSCPCDWQRGCCDDSKPFTPAHRCPKQSGQNEFCEACFTTKCASCGAECWCDL